WQCKQHVEKITESAANTFSRSRTKVWWNRRTLIGRCRIGTRSFGFGKQGATLSFLLPLQMATSFRSGGRRSKGPYGCFSTTSRCELKRLGKKTYQTGNKREEPDRLDLAPVS